MSETFEKRDGRLQDTVNRQNSIESDDKMLSESWNMMQAEVILKAKEAYKWALDRGIAKEQARAVLPEGNTQTTMYMAGSLRSWIHYCELRMANGTQKEHMDVAKQCWSIIGGHFPDVVKALEK